MGKYKILIYRSEETKNWLMSFCGRDGVYRNIEFGSFQAAIKSMRGYYSEFGLFGREVEHVNAI